MAERHRYIPSDILLNILVKIPASSLGRLKIVSKQWFVIISNPYFVKVHVGHQSRKELSWGVFLNTSQGIHFMEGTPSPIHNPPQPINLPGASGQTYVLGSCDGLVLFSSFGEDLKFHVGNPITRESLIIPPMMPFFEYNKSYMSASIGRVCSTGKFKVVVVARQLQHTDTTPFVCGILDLGSSIWREMLTPMAGDQLDNPYVPPLFVKGALHWRYDTGILSLDLGREKFFQTEVTFCSSMTLKQCSNYIVWDGCYSVTFQHQQLTQCFTVWILRELGWTKLDINPAFFERLGYSIGDECPDICTTIRNGETLVFMQLTKDASFLVYDLSRQVITKFAQFDKDFLLNYKPSSVVPMIGHVNSLVSCSSNSAQGFLLSKGSRFSWNGQPSLPYCQIYYPRI